jgi:hypothetical protein
MRSKTSRAFYRESLFPSNRRAIYQELSQLNEA